MKFQHIAPILLLAASQAANAGTINFDDLALPDYGHIATNYADHGLGGNGDSRVGVSYSGSNGTTDYLDFWNNDYGNLSKVAFTPSTGTNARINFTADTGWLISSISFDLAGWPHTDLLADLIHINIGAGSVTFGPNWPVEGSSGHSGFGYGSGTGGHTAFIEWGTDWNIGIDNIQFEVIADPGTGSVPEPATPALLAAALGALAILRRRKTT